MKAFWDELNLYLNPLAYTYGGLNDLAKQKENERVMQFLMGLNEFYAIVWGSILMMSPLLNTRKAHASVHQQDRQVDVASQCKPNTDHHAMELTHLQQMIQLARTSWPSTMQEGLQEATQV